MNDSEMDTVTTSIAERGEYVPYHNTRKEIHELTKKMETPAVPSVKDMPAYDPDAEAVGLTLTIPTWASSISRVKIIMDKTKMSREARKNLVEALKKLKNRRNAIRIRRRGKRWMITICMFRTFTMN